MPLNKAITTKKTARPAKGKKVLKVEDPPIETAAEIFTILSTKAPLQAGLCIVRPLGGGRFELVSLDKVPQGMIGSEEAAELMQSVPERKAAMKISEGQWNSAKLKCDAVIRATGKLIFEWLLMNELMYCILEKDIFRFFKLPVELRFKIYKLVVFNPAGIKLKTRAQYIITPSNGCRLMLASRRFYEECSQFYFINTFHLEHKQIVKLRTMPNLVKKPQEIQFDWEVKYSDAKSFSDLGGYPNLHVLNLSVRYGCLRLSETVWSRNRLFRDEPSIKRFYNLPGFDNLVSIRGLQCVTFKVDRLDDPRNDISAETQKDIEAAANVFEDFLNKELTKQKDVLPPV